MTVNLLEFEIKQRNTLCRWKTFPAGCKNLLMVLTKEILKEIGIHPDGDIILTNSLYVGGNGPGN